MFDPIMINNPHIQAPDEADIRRFCHAARDGDMAVVRELHDRFGAAIINRQDDIEACAMTWAAYNGHRHILDYLLENGANIEGRGTARKTALGWAAVMGRVETVSYLLSKGASLDAVDEYGETPLTTAQKSGNDELIGVVQHWIEKGRQEALEKEHAERQARERLISAAAAERVDRLRQLRAPKINKPKR